MAARSTVLPCLFVIFPLDRECPGITDTMTAVRALPDRDPRWKGWHVWDAAAGNGGSFSPGEIATKCLKNMESAGEQRLAVVGIQSHRDQFANLARRLDSVDHLRVETKIISPGEATHVLEVLDEVRRAVWPSEWTLGEFVALRAVDILAGRYQSWGGTNKKSYTYRWKLETGWDSAQRAVLDGVIAALIRHGWLLDDKKQGAKLAVNGEHSKAIKTAIRERRLPNGTLRDEICIGEVLPREWPGRYGEWAEQEQD
jgi:hypothetical protein